MATMGNGPQLSKSEAARYLRDGTLPENFRDRVQLLVECYECENCDGRLCMDCVLRIEHDSCRNDCPFCCEDGLPVALAP